jgi:hypothetical protein
LQKGKPFWFFGFGCYKFLGCKNNLKALKPIKAVPVLVPTKNKNNNW